MDEKLTWHRVTKAEPCGICEKPDWCTISDKGRCCMRAESPKQMRNGGWWFPFDDNAPKPTVFHVYPKPPQDPPPDFGALMRGWRAATEDHKMDEIAKTLGVSALALDCLRVTWAEERKAIAFPMYDATDHDGECPCGIRLRTMDGKKFAVTGSKSGVFIPYGAHAAPSKLNGKRIFICEGPTDTAACLDIGYYAIGRASCRGGEDIILAALAQLNPREVIVVCDNDGPGVAGADELMTQLDIPKTRLVPTGKDLRGFLRDGGNRELIDTMLKNIVRQ